VFIDADIAAATQPLIHQVDQRLDPLGERDDPDGLRGSRQLNPVPGEDRFLAVQRQRIDVFTGDQMGEQPGRRIRSGQDLRRQPRRPHTLLAAGAGVLLAHMLQHLDLRRHVVELLCDLAPDLGERIAARALALALRDLVHDRHPGQMSGDGLAAGLRTGIGFILALRRGFEVHFGAERLVQLDQGFCLVEQLRLAGGYVQLLATRPVAIGLQEPQRLL
jgi:hypothetical protein